jgi:hypothetical protein
MSAPMCSPGVPRSQVESGGIFVTIVLAATGLRVPSGGVARQGVALTDLRQVVDDQ